MREGIDFGEMFAPTVPSSCVCLLSTIAYEFGLDVCHFDVKHAFVRSKVDEDVFLRLLKGGHSMHISHHAHAMLGKAKLPTVFSRCVRLSFG